MRIAAPTIEIAEPIICRPFGQSRQNKAQPSTVVMGTSDSMRSAFAAVVLCRAW